MEITTRTFDETLAYWIGREAAVVKTELADLKRKQRRLKIEVGGYLDLQSPYYRNGRRLERDTLALLQHLDSQPKPVIRKVVVQHLTQHSSLFWNYAATTVFLKLLEALEYIKVTATGKKRPVTRYSIGKRGAELLVENRALTREGGTK